MFHTSIIELSERALRTNLEFLRDRIGPKTIFSSVVKGNAYGHGINHFIPKAQECGVDHFSVFSAGEALAVLEARTEPCEIMIMGYIDEAELEWAVDNEIAFYVFDLERLRATNRAAARVGKKAKVHLELETGMNRTGLPEDQLGDVADLILHNGNTISVDGVCTHFAGAESTANYWRIQKQLKNYRRMTGKLKRLGIKTFAKHVASSAATFAYPKTIQDMVRVGIAQYGYWPSKEILMHYFLESGIEDVEDYVDPLKRVIRWKSRVMSVKTVKPGEYIGYGISFLTTRTTHLATVPIGYWHGFARSLSNLGKVLVRGQRVPVIGTVNMNMILVDTTDIGQVDTGDEVVIIGKQGEREISLGTFSDLGQYLNYEVLVRLPGEIPRTWVG